MKKALLLCLCIGWLPATAQERMAGPWRLVEHRQRLQSWTADITTVVQTRLDPVLAAWNINPATITLLRNCENPLLAPPAHAGIRFTVTGTALQLNKKQQRLILVPTKDAVVLAAYRRHKRLFIHTFQVATIPLPKVLFHYSADAEIIARRPTANRHLVTLRAIPDQNFARILPTDARYRVAQFQVTLLRRGQVIANDTVQGAQAELSSWRSISQPGDSLRVSVLKMERQNFGLAVEPVLLPAPIRFATIYQD